MPRARLLLTFLPLLACRATEAPPAASAAAPARKLLTLEQTMGQGEKVDFTGELPRISWAEDGVHLVREEKGSKVWIDPVSGTESEPAAAEAKAKESAADEAAAKKELQAALVAAGVAEDTAKKARSVRRTPGGALTGLVEGELWWAKAGAARVLAGAAEGALELEQRSPDERLLTFVQANDLVLVDLENGLRTDVTADGSEDVFNGKLDWVYQEELYGRGDFKGFWWSPDSRRLAFLRLDEGAVFDFTVVDHIEPGHFRVKPEVTRYPKVGDPNPVVALGVVEAGAPDSVCWIDLAKYAAEEPLVVRVDWAPDGTLFFMVQDRIQQWLELVALDSATLTAHVVLRESSSGWVNRPDAPRWLADGTFLWLSERSGQRHLYRYRADGTLVGTLTSGEWSVSGIEEVDEAGRRLWFTATKDGAVNANLYRVALDGTGLVRLTSGPGRHMVRWNTARTFFLDRVSSLAEPTRLVLCDGEGKVVRELARAAVPDLEAYATSRWELLTIPARDGFELDAALLPPVGFDGVGSEPGRRYPVWLPTYSGPDAPSVANTWSSSSWNQFLAQNGVMVFQVNVRSASGKGQRATESCYEQLGVQELRDLEDAVDWLVANRSADPQRVGISGGSYGGFMAAYALTHSDRFALGVAASGVYDWRMYDTIYTERYMSTPTKNPDGYARTSVIEAAANLKGHLLITHGEMDDNVHLQNALQLVYALQKADRDFELMIFPQSRHGIDRELRWFERRLTWRAIREHLLGRD